jgi:DEAD/DEAH box helicase domain-containing protein
VEAAAPAGAVARLGRGRAAGQAPVDYDEPRIFVYDNYPGGIGFSAPLFGMHRDLVARTRELIAGCPCESGCPSCVGPLGDVGAKAKTVALEILGRLE